MAENIYEKFLTHFTATENSMRDYLMDYLYRKMTEYFFCTLCCGVNDIVVYAMLAEKAQKLIISSKAPPVVQKI